MYAARGGAVFAGAGAELHPLLHPEQLQPPHGCAWGDRVDGLGRSDLSQVRGAHLRLPPGGQLPVGAAVPEAALARGGGAEQRGALALGLRGLQPGPAGRGAGGRPPREARLARPAAAPRSHVLAAQPERRGPLLAVPPLLRLGPRVDGGRTAAAAAAQAPRGRHRPRGRGLRPRGAGPGTVPRPRRNRWRRHGRRRGSQRRGAAVPVAPWRPQRGLR
mmetsp:Transcript_9260/g.29434  ORF Transcript_9260/g.29434 Transcript_9260/m.29434 type:complete len:218 (-) Transcript_9260:445-1098(-)